MNDPDTQGNPMRTNTKRFTAISLLGGLTFSLCACASWDEERIDIDNAYKLQATAVVDDGLKINLGSKDPIFSKDIVKGDVLLVDKQSIKSSKGDGQFTMNDVLKARMAEDQFSLSFLDESNLAITIKRYAVTRYDIYVTRAITKNNVLAIASVSLVQDQESVTPYFKLDTDSFQKGETDPEIKIDFYNTEVADSTKVAFDESFSGLQAGNISANENTLSIKTKGVVGDDPLGVITLQDGFFKGITGELKFYADIDTSLACIDQKTFELTGSVFSFKMKAIGTEFESRIAKSNVSLDPTLNKLSVSAAKYIDASTISIDLMVLDDDLTDVNSVLEYMQNHSFTISNGFKDLPGDFSFTFLPNFPSLSLRTSLSKATYLFEIEAEVHNATQATFEIGDISFESSNIVLDGADANMTLSSFSQSKNGFKAAFTPADSFGDRAYGKLNVLNKVKTLWGASYSLGKLFDTKDVSVGKTVLEDLPAFEERIIKSSLKTEDLKNGFALDSYSKQVGYQFGEDVYGKSLSALINMLDFFHVTGDQTDPNGVALDDALDQLNDCFDAIDRDVDQLEDYLDLYDDAAERLGIDPNHFDSVRSVYDDFRLDCKDAFENAIFEYRNTFRDELMAMVNSTEATQRVSVYFATDANNNTVLTIPSPDNTDVSIDGETITDMYALHIPTTYFAPCAAVYATNHAFDEGFKASFKSCLATYLTENPRENINVDRLYGTIIGGIQMKAFKTSYVTPLIASLTQYIDELTENGGISALSAYLEMITCRVNFQSEAEDLFHSVRAKMKHDLAIAMSFVSMLDKFAASELLDDTLITKYRAVEADIMTNDHLIAYPLNTEYSYALHSPIQGHVMQANFNVSYNGEGNNASFASDFHFTENEKAVAYFNEGAVISSEEIGWIYQRFLLLAADVPQNDFPSYLVANGILSQDQIDLLEQKQGDDLPLLTSFDGIAACEPFEGEAVSSPSGISFNVGSTYAYGGNSEQGKTTNPNGWQGKEARGTLLSLNDLTPLGNLLDAYARYDDGHPFNQYDDHCAFDLNEDGYYFAVILRA